MAGGGWRRRRSGHHWAKSPIGSSQNPSSIHSRGRLSENATDSITKVAHSEVAHNLELGAASPNERNPIRKLILSLAFTAISVLRGAPILSVLPPVSAAAPGDTISIDIAVSAIADLAAFQFDFNFAPTVLAGLGVTEGSFLSAGGSSFFIHGALDNGAGTISGMAGAIVGLGPGVSGSGTLVTILLKDVAPGSSLLQLSNVLLLNSAGEQIVAAVQGAAVNTPEPAYGLATGLILVGLGTEGN